MSAEIRTLKDGETTVYPRTLASAVYNDDGTTIDTTIQSAIDDTTQLTGDINTILENILTGDEEDTADFYVSLSSSPEILVNDLIITKSNYTTATGIIGEPYKINLFKTPYIHNNISYNAGIYLLNKDHAIVNIKINNISSIFGSEMWCYNPIDNNNTYGFGHPILLKLNPNDVVKIIVQYS